MSVANGYAMYRIRIVDASDEDVADTLADLHQLTFFDAAAMPQFDLGAWWLEYHGDNAVAFAGVVPSTHVRNSGYFSRVGVLRRHWGHGLQIRLMRAIEARGAALDGTVSFRIRQTIPCLPITSSSQVIGSMSPRYLGPGRIHFTGESGYGERWGAFPATRNACVMVHQRCGVACMRRMAKSPAAGRLPGFFCVYRQCG